MPNKLLREQVTKRKYIGIICVLLIVSFTVTFPLIGCKQAVETTSSITAEPMITATTSPETTAATATSVTTATTTAPTSATTTEATTAKEPNESSTATTKFKWGDVLLSAKDWGGVDIYYNTEAWNYVNGQSTYGLKWQCVEMVRRFYSQFNFGLLPGVARAYQMFDAVKGKPGFETFENGSRQKPIWGDILVFGSGKGDGLAYGHVAIVIEINRVNKKIYFVQQNVGINAKDSLPIDDNNFISYSPSEKNVAYPPVRGWIHSNSNNG